MAQYYVSSAGNDSNNGTSTSTPWLTLGKMNTVGLDAGDTVSFRGGDSFSGNLLIDPATPPTSTTRITVKSYGAGRATINCANSYGVKALNCGYVTVHYINVTGSGINVSGSYPPGKTVTTSSTTPGVLVQTTTTSTWYAGLVIDYVTVTGCLMGVRLVSTNTSATAAHENFRVSRCDAHSCGVVGVMVNGSGTGDYPHEHFGTCFRGGRILDCQAYDIPGIASYSWDGPSPIQTGFGFFVLNCLYTIVDRCLATRCGDGSNASSPGGPCGFIFVECTSSVIRYCEASFIYATSSVDGEPFDLDAGCLNCIVEHCYGHDSDGPGILLYQFGAHNTHAGSIIRYNIFENCCRNNNQVYDENDGVGTPQCYHNTFWFDKASGPMVQAINTVFRNNIFAVKGGASFGTFAATSVLTGNTYYAASGSSFSLTFNSTTYTTLAGMQADGLEKIGSRTTGASGDPLFVNAGGGSVCLPSAQVSQLVNYDLGNGSVAQGAGIDLLEFFIIPPSLDWHNNPAVYGETDTLSGIDSGAVRKGSTVWLGFAGVR